MPVLASESYFVTLHNRTMFISRMRITPWHSWVLVFSRDFLRGYAFFMGLIVKTCRLTVKNALPFNVAWTQSVMMFSSDCQTNHFKKEAIFWKLLVWTLIRCHFDYACSAWYSGLSKKLKKRLQVMQNNVFRYMLNVPPRTHIGVQEFREVGLLPLESNLNLITCLTS
jgi:hypothetical protein